MASFGSFPDHFNTWCIAVIIDNETHTSQENKKRACSFNPSHPLSSFNFAICSGGVYLRINDRTELGLLFTSILSFFLMLITFLSFLVFMEYTFEESVLFPFYLSLCLPLFFTMLLLFITINIHNGYFVSKVSDTPQALRAFYIFIFYPILLVSFMIATIEYGFQTSLIYGFPIFFLGVILLPYSALVIHREALAIVNKNMLLVYCHNCRYTFEMHRLDIEKRCPICGSQNRATNVVPKPK